MPDELCNLYCFISYHNFVVTVVQQTDSVLRRPRCRDVQITHNWKQTPAKIPLKERSARRRGYYIHDTQPTQEKDARAISGIRTRDPIS